MPQVKTRIINAHGVGDAVLSLREGIRLFRQTTGATTIADSPPATTDPLPATDPRSLAFKDRRNFPRRRPRGSATFVPAAKPMAPGSAIIPINISQSGISFLASKPLELGQRILIDLLAPGHGRPLTVEAEIRWISPAAKAGKHLVGCAWLKRLDYSELIRFF